MIVVVDIAAGWYKLSSRGYYVMAPADLHSMGMAVSGKQEVNINAGLLLGVL